MCPLPKYSVMNLGLRWPCRTMQMRAALAEWLMGAGKGTSNMIFLTFGTGMGSGLILNSKLYSGTNDLGW